MIHDQLSDQQGRGLPGLWEDNYRDKEGGEMDEGAKLVVTA
jgi:hypothetical protein